MDLWVDRYVVWFWFLVGIFGGLNEVCQTGSQNFKNPECWHQSLYKAREDQPKIHGFTPSMVNWAAKRHNSHKPSQNLPGKEHNSLDHLPLGSMATCSAFPKSSSQFFCWRLLALQSFWFGDWTCTNKAFMLSPKEGKNQAFITFGKRQRARPHPTRWCPGGQLSQGKQGSV